MDEGAGEIAGATADVVIRCVEQVSGADGLARLAELVPEYDEIAAAGPLGWISLRQARDLLFTAIEVTADPRFAYFCGQRMLAQYEGTETFAVLQSFGSPGELLRQVAITSAKLSTASVMSAVEIADDHALISCEVVPGSWRDRAACDLTEGVLSQSGPVFGLPTSEVREVSCVCRGDPQCLYEVRWGTDATGPVDPERRVEWLEGSLAAIRQRFDGLKDMVRELMRIDGLDAVLDAVIARAAVAVRAHRYVLAVRVADEEIRTRSLGFDDPGGQVEAAAIGRELLGGVVDDRGGSRLVAELGCDGHAYGRLAALVPPGMHFFDVDRELFDTYAATAAAALRASEALEEARRQHDTSSALLRLATALAEVTTPEAAGRRLAEAVPRALGVEQCAVLIWDEARGELHGAGVTGFGDATLRRVREVGDLDAIAPALLARSDMEGPVVVAAATAPEPVRELLESTAVARVCVVPIRARGEFLGIVAVALDPGNDAGLPAELAARLQAMAGQAATALQNARLLDRVREQALRDGLTGLPNRALLEERVERALSGAARDGTPLALLFVDLDRFKGVNDRWGHRAGDAVLREVGSRLVDTLRAGDTVARLGGDEFAVLLPQLQSAGDAPIVAEKLLHRLRAAIRWQGHEIRVPASIGVAVATVDDDFERLLGRADQAMYAAKAAGRNGQASAEVA